MALSDHRTLDTGPHRFFFLLRTCRTSVAVGVGGTGLPQLSLCGAGLPGPQAASRWLHIERARRFSGKHRGLLRVGESVRVGELGLLSFPLPVRGSLAGEILHSAPIWPGTAQFPAPPLDCPCPAATPGLCICPSSQTSLRRPLGIQLLPEAPPEAADFEATGPACWTQVHPLICALNYNCNRPSCQ